MSCLERFNRLTVWYFSVIDCGFPRIFLVIDTGLSTQDLIQQGRSRTTKGKFKGMNIGMIEQRHVTPRWTDDHMRIQDGRSHITHDCIWIYTCIVSEKFETVVHWSQNCSNGSPLCSPACSWYLWTHKIKRTNPYQIYTSFLCYLGGQ